MDLLDFIVLIGYLLVTVGLGCWFAIRKLGTEDFMAGGRALPGWAIGLSMFGSYVSSISFLANPGKSYSGNWNAFVFSLATPLAAWVAVRWFVPFFRRTGEVSAYDHLEHRFGPWARTYGVVCFLLSQVTRTGSIIYLLALPVATMTGWEVSTVVVLTGVLMIVYSIFGGIEAVVWIGVVQSVVLIAGPIICIVAILAMMPGGISAVFEAGVAGNKFSLGSLSLSKSIAEPTFWLVLVYGFIMNLQNFGIDQSYVQRYIAARDDAAATRSVWITTWLYVPVAGFFFLIGTALFALNEARPELFPSELNISGQPDRALPYFITHYLPLGMGGLVVAAIFASSMDSSLSSMATLTLCDVYKRYFRPDASERESMWVLRGSTLIWGLLSLSMAVLMIGAQSALDERWKYAGIFSGGMLGLFLLGLMSRRANNAIAIVSTAAGIVVIGWMSLSPTPIWPESLSHLRSPYHNFMIPVLGTLTILILGLFLAAFSQRTRPETPGR